MLAFALYSQHFKVLNCFARVSKTTDFSHVSLSLSHALSLSLYRCMYVGLVILYQSVENIKVRAKGHRQRAAVARVVAVHSVPTQPTKKQHQLAG